MRIAIAEDEPDVRDYFRRILPQLGHEVVGVAENGRELVELCRSSSPDLVISDLRMPDMDGDMAMQTVWSERPMPCIFVSAFSKPTPASCRGNGHGCLFLTKPVSRDELELAIKQLFLPLSDSDRLT